MKVIAFDLDGTIINSDALVMEIYAKLTDFYVPDVPFDSFDQNDVLALSYPEVLRKLYGKFDEYHFQKILELHKELKHQYLKTYPGVLEMLTALKEKGYDLSLVTSEMHDIAADELNILGLSPYFDLIVAFDDVNKPKPHPDGLHAVMHFYGCQPHEIIMVGDQLTDANAAKNAGVFSVLMDHDMIKPSEIRKMFHHVAYDTAMLVEIIANHDSLFLTMPENHDLKILQLTDLHLMNDEKDIRTFNLMHKFIETEKPDLIVLTGDQTMSSEAIRLYQKLGSFLDQFGIPFTFVFGNHDLDGGHSYQELIDAIKAAKFLRFDQGPVHLGYSNFNMILLDQNTPVGRLTFMDSHIDDFFMIDGQKTWGYGAFSQDQIDWYKLTQNIALPHLIFFHIPLVEMKEISPDDHRHHGDYEENPSVQGINTGFFDVANQTHQAKGMFFGHDHYNDFSYTKDGIILAFGRVSGHYDYGAPGFPRGARIITFNREGELKTHVVKIIDE